MLTQNEVKLLLSQGMSFVKIQAFFNEFIWLKKYFKQRDIWGIYVSRVEEDFMGYAPRYTSGYDWGAFEVILFLDRNGDKVYPLGGILLHLMHLCSYHFLDSCHYRYSIRGRLRTLKENLTKVHFICSYDKVHGSLIIYKMSNNKTLSEMIENYDTRINNALIKEQDYIKENYK